MGVGFQRHPPSGGSSTEFRLEVSGTTLSGLLAEPPEPEDTRGVLVALHGANMHAGYFDAQIGAGLSLLDLGSSLGYTVWAPDRPGVGASADLAAERLRLFPQAELLLDAIDEFALRRPCGSGVLLVGHSYGLKVAWTMAASTRGSSLLGVDGSGSGVRYAFEWAPRSDHPGRSRADVQDRAWGPRGLYPEGTISRRSLPLHPVPPVQAEEGGRWPEDIRAMADRITVPIRLTFGEHEALWPTGSEALDEIRTVFKSARRIQIEIEPGAGHNISLGWAARSYHLKVLAFAESLRLERQLA
jgi:pimeloyl-ACP methyl ester carboxylesterase